MPTAAQETLLCRYHYDPLDRLIDCLPINQASLQRFYCKSRLASEIQGAIRTSVFQFNDHLLAQHQQDASTSDSQLLATDAQRSVVYCLSPSQRQPSTYSPYGQRTPKNGLLSLLGFNGERPDPLTGHYLLGNGYRAFNPVLMRFNSPDSLSPFGEGGLNSYAYCQGDPVNQVDPSGHIGTNLLKPLKRLNPLKRLSQQVAPGARARKIDNPIQKTLEDRKLRQALDKQSYQELSKASAMIDETSKYFQGPSTFIGEFADTDELQRAFRAAQGRYSFQRYPSTTIPYYLTTGELDLRQFEVTKMYYRNFPPDGANSIQYSTAHRVNVKSAEYILNHPKTNPTAIRQPILPSFSDFKKPYFKDFERFH